MTPPIPVFAPYDVLPYSRCFDLVMRPTLTLPAKVTVPA